MKTPRYRAVSSSIWLLSLSLSLDQQSSRTSSTGDKARSSPSSSLVLVNRPVCKVVARKCQGNVLPNVMCVSWDKEEEVVVVVCCTPSFSRNGSRVCSTCLDCSWRKRRFQNSCSSKSESGSESGSKFSDISFPFLPLSLFSSPVNWSHLQIPRENSLYRFARIYSSLRHFCVSRSDWDRRSLWPMRFYHRSGPVWINRIV